MQGFGYTGCQKADKLKGSWWNNSEQEAAITQKIWRDNGKRRLYQSSEVRSVSQDFKSWLAELVSTEETVISWEREEKKKQGCWLSPTLQSWGAHSWKNRSKAIWQRKLGNTACRIIPLHSPTTEEQRRVRNGCESRIKWCAQPTRI